MTFLHQSAKDYLTKGRGLSIAGRCDFSIPNLNQLATSHLTEYLHKVRCHSASRDTEQIKITQIMEDLPLASYAIKYWHHHARECIDISSVIQQNFEFFNECSESRALWQRLCSDLAWAYSGLSVIPLLHLSCIIGIASLAVWCVERKQTYSLERTWGNAKTTPLHEACLGGHEAIVNILLDAGASAVIKDGRNRTSINYAVKEFGGDILRRMALQRPGENWLREQADNPHSRLLFDAAEYGNESACRFLVEEFAWDVNQKTSGAQPYDTPVMSALAKGHLELARILILEWQAHFEDWRALYSTTISFSHGLTEQMIHFLISQCSVDINATDPAGHTVLCVMFRRYSSWYYPDVFYSVLQTILDLGCNIGEPDNRGRTALHCCAMELDFSLSPTFIATNEYLLLRGRLDINHSCFDGQTILHHFVETLASCNPDWFSGRLIFVSRSLKGLLDLGSDRELRNLEGHSALRILQLALHRVGYEDHDDYKGVVDRAIFVLENYSTVPFSFV